MRGTAAAIKPRRTDVNAAGQRAYRPPVRPGNRGCLPPNPRCAAPVPFGSFSCSGSKPGRAGASTFETAFLAARMRVVFLDLGMDYPFDRQKMGPHEKRANAAGPETGSAGFVHCQYTPQRKGRASDARSEWGRVKPKCPSTESSLKDHKTLPQLRRCVKKRGPTAQG